MSVLNKLDDAAKEKGSGINTLWQFVKFIVVSLGACIVQFLVLNLLQALPQIQELYSKPFDWFVFHYSAESNGLGYFIAFNVANVLAQIVAFFINREKTFNSSSNIPLTLSIYVIFTVLLLCFSAWLSPTINAFLIEKEVSASLAGNISTAICSALQFFIYFPFDKLLFSKKKKKK